MVQFAGGFHWKHYNQFNADVSCIFRNYLIPSRKTLIQLHADPVIFLWIIYSESEPILKDEQICSAVNVVLMEMERIRTCSTMNHYYFYAPLVIVSDSCMVDFLRTHRR